VSATDQVDPGRSTFNYGTGTTLWFATVLVSQPCHEAPQFACTGFGLCHCNFVDERAWRDVFPSRAVLELGGFGRASRRHESKAYNFTESECWLPALRSRVRARGLVHGYFLRRESLSRVKRCNSAQRGANADLAKHLASAMLRNGVKTRAKTQLRTTFTYARTLSAVS